MEGKKIEDWTILGVNLYRKERLYETTLDLALDRSIDVPFIGLNSIVKETEFEYGDGFFSEKIDWEATVFNTLYLTVMSLVLKGNLKLIAFEDKKGVFSNWFEYNKEGFYPKFIQYESNLDLLSKIVLDAAYKFQNVALEKKNLQTFLGYVIDHYLDKKETHHTPEYVFMNTLLSRYERVFEWFSIQTVKKHFGLTKVYKPQIEYNHLLHLIDLHQNFETELIYLEDTNLPLSAFKASFKTALQAQFGQREEVED